MPGKDVEVGIESQPRSLPHNGSKFENHKFYEPRGFEAHNSFCTFVMAGVRNAPHRLRHLNTWSSVGGASWGGDWNP